MHLPGKGNRSCESQGARVRRPSLKGIPLESSAHGAQHTRRSPVGVGGLLVGLLEQSSLPLRVNCAAIAPTGLRVGPIGPQVLSRRSCPPPEQLTPAVVKPEQVRLGAAVHELQEPHEPAVKPVK